jgi:hypothetical protein
VQFSCFIMDRLHPLHPAWNMSWSSHLNVTL